MLAGEESGSAGKVACSLPRALLMNHREKAPVIGNGRVPGSVFSAGAGHKQ